MKYLKDDLEIVQRIMDYTFKNVDLLVQAFTRSSYSHENGGKNNEILEFIGDRVLDFYVTKILIDRYSNTHDLTDKGELTVEKYDNEGSLTEIKKKLVNEKILAHRIDLLEFKDYLLMGNGDIKDHIEDNESVKGDLFEAILGAIAIDSKWNQKNLENSVKVMLNIDHYLYNGFSDEDECVV